MKIRYASRQKNLQVINPSKQMNLPFLNKLCITTISFLAIFSVLNLLIHGEYIEDPFKNEHNKRQDTTAKHLENISHYKVAKFFGLPRLKNVGSYDMYWRQFDDGIIVRVVRSATGSTITIVELKKKEIISTKKILTENLLHDTRLDIFKTLDKTAQSYPAFPVSEMEYECINLAVLDGKWWGIHYISEDSVVELDSVQIEEKALGDTYNNMGIRRRDFNEFSQNFKELLGKLIPLAK